MTDPQIPDHANVPETPTKDQIKSLPLEIRQMIYINLIATGAMEILRVSRYVFEEAKTFIHGNAVFRLRITMPEEGLDPRRLTTETLGSIQNINIQISLHQQTRYEIVSSGFNQMFHFGMESSRGTCIFTLRLNRKASAYFASDTHVYLPYLPVRWSHTEMCRLLRSYNRFKELEFRLECFYFEGDKPLTLDQTVETAPLDFSQAYLEVQDSLEDYLGPSKYVRDPQDHRLEFAPATFRPIRTPPMYGLSNGLGC